MSDQAMLGMTARQGLEYAQKGMKKKRGKVVLFMVIERFAANDMVPIYRHLKEAGRGTAGALTFIDSWVEANFGRCFQLMECSDAKELQAWVLHWRGLGATFEIVPVVQGNDTAALVTSFVDNTDKNSTQ